MTIEDTPDIQREAQVVSTAIANYSVFSTWEKRYIVSLVALAGWFSTLSSFMYYPIIDLIAKDLHTTVGRINLTVTSYMVVSAVAPAIVGDAADRFGRRPFYIISLTIYFLANMGIALQKRFVALLLLRMLQSAGISGEENVGTLQVSTYKRGQLPFPSLMA
jgi:MFS family permease